MNDSPNPTRSEAQPTEAPQPTTSESPPITDLAALLSAGVSVEQLAVVLVATITACQTIEARLIDYKHEAAKKLVLSLGAQHTRHFTEVFLALGVAPSQMPELFELVFSRMQQRREEAFRKNNPAIYAPTDGTTNNDGSATQAPTAGQ